MKIAQVIPNTPTKDNKAELILITQLHDKNEWEKKQFCNFIGVPWEEYQRLLRKWSRVIARWGAEGGEKDD